MEKLYVRRQAKKNIYVHNDLSNAAFHLLERIDEMERTDNREGIGLDVMACLTMMAFTFEAKINFLGFKVIAEWKEKQPFHKKVES